MKQNIGKEELIVEREFVFNNELFDDELNKDVLDKQGYCLGDMDSSLTEQDFYPPSDNRTWKSNVEDIDGGDNFADYCVEFFEMLDEDGYYDN